MADTSPKADYKQEVRFAVVMYGGVSLAIYINGITQELFHLVNSTAPKKAGDDEAVSVDELTPTQRVYRKLSYILSNREFRERCQKEAKDQAKLKKPYKVPPAPTDDAIETRFVIDILSGTSAGGINAIFLGKALANNQNIDQLKELWVNEGDIGLLLNDKTSVRGLGLQRQVPPLSLLNSRRMYLKLLKAFDDMEKSKTNGDGESRFLDEAELDLFITTTDIAGVPLPMRLSDSVVFERRHRNVFHFKYAPKETIDDKPANGPASDGKTTTEGRNDFLAKNNPFLAFAARCTSSFPFAFEPMRLADIDEVLDTFPQYRANGDFRGASEAWQRFFNRNVIGTIGKNIVERPFGDGGYLDNKPFSFAVDTISRREAEITVDRKLIYIEPSPEHPEDDNPAVTQMDALRNVKAAILDLPMYETIREDLERVMDRNNLIDRVNQITDAIEQDLEASGLKRPTLRDDEWEKLDLAGMVQRFGIYYIPYRRLRIEDTSDELARTVARRLSLDEDSAHYTAVRALIHAWREQTYIDENVQRRDERIETLARELTDLTTREATKDQIEEVEGKIRNWLQLHLSDEYRNSIVPQTDGQPQTDEQQPATTNEEIKTANQFLLHYDFKYWLRRIVFMRSKIDQLLQLHKVPGEAGKLDFTEKQAECVSRLNKFLGERTYEQLLKKEKDELVDLLTDLRAKLIKLHKSLRAKGRNIQSPSRKEEGSKFAEALKKIQLTPKAVDYLLGTVDEHGSEQPFSKLKTEDCILRAKTFFHNQELAKRFEAESLASDLAAAAHVLREALEPVLKNAWDTCKLLLDEPKGSLSPHAEGVRKYLWHYLTKFDDYDQVRFPIMYGTDSGESDVVEVFRIAPEDAPSLIDERAESKKPNGRLKLAGTSLHHFGAFLDRVWRQNDIMWGRLDGAERLITMLLPYSKDALVREALINEAHAAILREELSTESRSQLSTLMSEALIRASTGEPIEEAINKVMEGLTEASPVKTRLASAMTAIFDDDVTKTDDDKLVKFVKLGYQVNRQLDHKSVLQTISRSTQTIGGIFEDLANKNGLDGKSLSWIARLGQFFWGFVQVAVPNSILNKLVTHWLYLLYAFEAVIILAGVVLVQPEAQQFGWTALGITVAVHVLTLVLHDQMRGRGAVKRSVIILLAGILATLALIGFLKLVGLMGYRVGGELTPLSWISRLIFGVLEWTGPLKPYMPKLIPLAFVALVIVLLVRAGRRKLKRAAPKPESFKEIKLQKFKDEDMKDIFLKQESPAKVYSVAARLSAVPPIEWIRTFEKEWRRNNSKTEVRVYRDQVRFEADAEEVSKIWNRLQATVRSSNRVYGSVVEKQNEELKKRQKEEQESAKKARDEKWKTFGNLS